MRRSTLFVTLGLAMLATASSLMQTPAPAPAANQTNLGSDANGNPLRRALKTGHISNYDENKVAPYTLPDPLVMVSGTRVTGATMWNRQRRPELLRLYAQHIYGRVPTNVPKIAWEVSETDAHARDGAALLKRVVGHVGSKPDGPQIRVSVYTPAQATKKVPIILLLNFGGGPARAGGPPAAAGRGNAATGEPPNAAEILARGWGYATVGYNDIQPDKANAFDQGVIGATGKMPGADEWGDVSAWAWGVSRVIDYLATDPRIDATRIALHGHSRIGKTALWASALDPRIAAVYASCPGEMGAALSRRDYGETVDDMAQRFPYWFDRNFQKWVGRWNEMPVDAHTLIALSAPRPVFVTGGSEDQWADPVGEFKALVAAGPVYRLLGKKDLGTTDLPALDTPQISGDLGWYYHKGPHAATVEDWKVFLQFLDKYFT